MTPPDSALVRVLAADGTFAPTPEAERYLPLIEEHLGACQILAEAEGFRIYRARRR